MAATTATTTTTSLPEKHRVWRLAKRPVGLLKDGDLVLHEEPLPQLTKDDQFLVKNIYVSIDPTQRVWMSDREQYIEPVAIGEPMRSGSLGIVVKSNTATHQVGDLVAGLSSMQEYYVATPAARLQKLDKAFIQKANIPLTAFLHILGLIGLTAYFGLLEIGKPKEGETVVVSAAAGATGSVVGQIAKAKGCRVVGLAGSDDKCRSLVEELGFDAAINYKTENIGESLKRHCPKGVDVYFDNVGGDILNTVVGLMNHYGRIVVCGIISQYNAESDSPRTSLRDYEKVLIRRLRVEGFIVLDYYPRASEALGPLASWYAEGKLQNRVHVVKGIENGAKAINMLFTGENNGRLIVQFADEPTL